VIDFSLMHDENFRAKVELAEGWLTGLPIEQRKVARLTMLGDMTRDQAMMYAATAADLRAQRFGYTELGRADAIAEAIREAQLEYDAAA
jgi:hypothetical protein